MNPFKLFERRFRGFRVVEIGGVGFLLILALVVYLAKTGAGDERADIDRIQQQIGDEQGRISLLRAEVARLEQPERLEVLSTRYLNLQPIPAAHEIDAQALADIARGPAPQPKAPVAAAAAVPDSAERTTAPPPSAKAQAAPIDPARPLAQPAMDDAGRTLAQPQPADASQ